MDEHTLLTIFVGLGALAMLIQAVMLVVMGVVALKLKAKVDQFTEPVQKLLSTSQGALSKVEGHIEKIGNQTGSILEDTKGQLAKVNELLQDATGRAKNQMDRAELVLDDTMNRVQTTASYIQSGVMRPVREIHGIFAGVRTALMHLTRPGRATVDNATSDEEMFI
jgi:hypothetical protein